MPLISGLTFELADGARETTQTTGTGTYQLGGAVTIGTITYRTFVAAAGSGTRVPYVVWFGAQFERGLGTVASGAPATITRDLILGSSNSNNPVSWAAGIKDIWLDAPSELLDQIDEDVLVSSVTEMKTTTFTSSGTFTTDVNCLFAHVRMVGGGGGGGGTLATGTNEGANGGGGGGGEYAEGRFTAATLGASKAVTIGSGGSASAGANGGTGGTTSLSTLMTALGGSGGTAGSDATGSTNAPGGDGGSGGTGGYFRRRGDDGGRGRVIVGVAVLTGYGGGSALGGQRQASDTTGSLSGRTYGGGGSGAAASELEGARAGGAGAAGIVIFEEFLHP